MKTITVQAFTFDELDENAKEKVRERNREVLVQDDWWDQAYEDIDQCAAVLGMDIERRTIRRRDGSTFEGGPNILFSGFASQGDGASFTGIYSHKPDAPQAIRQHAPKDATLHDIADDLEAFQQRMGGGVIATIKRDSSPYVHARTVTTNMEDNDDGKWTQEAEDELGEIMVRLMEWAYRQLEKEYDALTTDEAIDNELVESERLFTRNGDPGVTF